MNSANAGSAVHKLLDEDDRQARLAGPPQALKDQVDQGIQTGLGSLHHPPGT